MMRDGRLREMFEKLRGERAALIAYATGFYPDRARSEKIIRAMLESGADAVEIGIPFSDPVMDGPVIQNAGNRALRESSTTAGILELASSVRRGTDKPLLLMTYYNPVYRYGLGRFARDAAGSGVDGLIVPDLPVEEMLPLRVACDDAGLATCAFAAMTTSDERVKQAGEATTGFLYCVSLLGTTGTRSSLSEELPSFLSRVRGLTDRPLAAGLGVSTPGQCAEVGRLADGVIVGSAFMKAAARDNGDYRAVSGLVSEMAEALS